MEIVLERIVVEDEDEDEHEDEDDCAFGIHPSATHPQKGERGARCVSLSAARMPHARHALARARSARATWLRWDAHPVYFVRISGRIAGDFVFGQD